MHSRKQPPPIQEVVLRLVCGYECPPARVQLVSDHFHARLSQHAHEAARGGGGTNHPSSHLPFTLIINMLTCALRPHHPTRWQPIHPSNHVLPLPPLLLPSTCPPRWQHQLPGSLHRRVGGTTGDPAPCCLPRHDLLPVHIRGAAGQRSERYASGPCLPCQRRVSAGPA